MTQNVQIPFSARLLPFTLLLALSLCSFERNSALAGQGPEGRLSGLGQGTLQEAPAIPVSVGALPVPDDRYKADILLVVAHPDDEQAVTPYLARAVDEHKRVAVLYCTRGDGGHDLQGTATSMALADEREMEARGALRSLGITNVWFISTGRDSPSQSPLWSLENWNHGAALWQAVRTVRLTRPDIIISMLPVYTTGDNHGDHQAAGILATEAFDLAGNPTVFPEQVAYRILRPWGVIWTEGLSPWQPKKIYYRGNFDSAQLEAIKDQGPQYSRTDMSPSRHVSYSQLAEESRSNHLTQFSVRPTGDAAGAQSRGLQERPLQLIFGKSLVGGSITGDVFEGVVPGPIPFAPVRGYQPKTNSGMSVELGGPFAFYPDFWAAHDVERLGHLIPTPGVGVGVGEELGVQLLIHNYTNDPAKIDLTVELPLGWTERTGSARYPVGPHGVYPLLAILTSPSQGVGEWQQITWHARSAGQEIGSATINVFLEQGGGMPQ